VADVPAKVVTVMSTVPARPAGATAVMDVSELTVKAAATPPKFTAVAPMNALPVMVMASPPMALPEPGVTAETTGVAAAL
jgi:hypothetical protein